MLPDEYSRNKEAWRRKWRAKRKLIEAQEGQAAAAESGDPDPDEGEARDGEARPTGA